MKRNHIEKANILLQQRTDGESLRNKFNGPEIDAKSRKEHLNDKLLSQLKKKF